MCFEFKVQEVAEIMDKSHGQVKHLLVDSRKEMTDIFDGRCALVNQNGTCHQCSELQGLFNPKADFQRESLKTKKWFNWPMIPIVTNLWNCEKKLSNRSIRLKQLELIYTTILCNT